MVKFTTNYLEGTANLVAVCCGCALFEPDRNAPHILTFALSHLKRLCHRIVKALSKDDLFKQSKVVGRKWWGQSGGKGKRTATVLRADFKAALAKTTADAAAASEGEL